MMRLIGTKLFGSQDLLNSEKNLLCYIKLKGVSRLIGEKKETKMRISYDDIHKCEHCNISQKAGEVFVRENTIFCNDECYMKYNLQQILNNIGVTEND